jgi:hypothetical protein
MNSNPDPQFAYLNTWPTDPNEAESWMRSIAGALRNEAILNEMNPAASSVCYKFAALSRRLESLAALEARAFMARDRLRNALELCADWGLENEDWRTVVQDAVTDLAAHDNAERLRKEGK